MNLMKLTMALLSSLLLASMASASVTWQFGNTPGIYANGTSSSNSLGTVSVYAEQVNSSGTLQSLPDSTLCAPSSSNCLFQVNDSPNDDGIGIAPYNPTENGLSSNFTTQDGISDNDTTGIDNILEIELGSNIASGTTLSFLLQSGVVADNSDTVSVYYTTGNVTSPTSLGSMSVFDNSKTTPIGGISTNGSNPQFTITKDTSGTEFVAIQADCHYLLLDSITGAPPVTTSSVPEPKFYGLLLAGMLGLAGLYRRKSLVQAARNL
jgi:hypothetical protein